MPYFEIGVFQTKTKLNIGTLWRSAYQLGAAGIFTIGKRYSGQPGDTCKAGRHIPLRNYENLDCFLPKIPEGCVLIGVEIGGTPLRNFSHPKQAIYILGAEDGGLPDAVAEVCNCIVSVESMEKFSYNVAVAGSIVMYDRVFGFSQGASRGKE